SALGRRDAGVGACAGARRVSRGAGGGGAKGAVSASLARASDSGWARAPSSTENPSPRKAPNTCSAAAIARADGGSVHSVPSARRNRSFIEGLRPHDRAHEGGSTEGRPDGEKSQARASGDLRANR